jgi:hypothetical protein
VRTTSSHATLGRLRARFELVRRALERRDHDAVQLALREFENALHRRIELEQRLLVPALVGSDDPKHDLSRELATQHAQLRDLTRHVRAEIAGGADGDGSRGGLLGYVAGLDRRLASYVDQVERLYLPAATPKLGQTERGELASAV